MSKRLSPAKAKFRIYTMNSVNRILGFLDFFEIGETIVKQELTAMPVIKNFSISSSIEMKY